MGIDKIKQIQDLINLDKNPKSTLFNHIKNTEKEFGNIEKQINNIKQEVKEKISEDKESILREIKDIKDIVIPISTSKQGNKGDKGDTVDEVKLIQRVLDKIRVPKDGESIKGDKGDSVKGDKGDSIKGDKGDSIKGDKGDSIIGKQGESGKDGFIPEHEWRGTAIRFKKADGTWGIWMNLVGEKGRQAGGGNLETFIGGDKVGSSQRLHFIAGSGVTLSSSDEAGGTGITITSTGGATFIDDETPTGTVNGSNKVFTISDTPTSGSLKVYVNGQRQRVTEDYTFSGTTITFITAPPTTSIILVDFRT